MMIADPETNLSELASEVRKAVNNAVSMTNLARDAGRMAIKAAIDAGNLLVACKASLPHGSWGSWTKEHLSDISTETICRWMRLAKLSRETDLSGAETLSDAYQRCGILPEKPGEGGERAKASNPPLSAPQAVLRAGTALQKRLRLLTQGLTRLEENEANQLRLIRDELQDLFARVLGEVSHNG